jgi:hypothetical protein
VPEGSILVDPVMVGSGYGDPLDRDPNAVLNDIMNQAVSLKFARNLYGVVIDDKGHVVDGAKTSELRETMRAERLAQAKPVNPERRQRKLTVNLSKAVMRIHECLNIVEQGDSFAIACRKCNQDFGLADRNYKDACIYNMVDKDDLTELPPPSGRHSLGRYVEYYCPGCATLLEVETTVPHVEAVIESVWDIEIAPASIRNAAEQARRSVPSAAE